MSQRSAGRRRFLLQAGACGAAVASPPSFARVPKRSPRSAAFKRAPAMACYEFDAPDVTLLPGPFQDNMVRDLDYLLEFDCDRLLAPFQTVAGLPTGAPSLGGRERMGLASHYTGHFPSAASLLDAQTGDARLAAKIDYLLGHLAACQRANGRDDPQFDGYCTGIPDSKAAFRQALAGQLEVGDPHALYSFTLNGMWSPWYTVHKIMAGLRDVYVHLRRAQALRILVGIARWAAQYPGRLTSAQMQTMLISEQGGMNEVLADVAALTDESEYLRLAEQFNQRAQLDPLMRREDILSGLHSNQSIPRVIGLARQYELNGRADCRAGAEFFWENVARQRTYVFGGNGDHEDFFPIGDTWRHLTVGSAESCCTYNILKLTNHYFCWNATMEAADFFERGLVNHILGSQDPRTGMMTYYISMRPGHFKTFSTPWDSCWCCAGTGMENHARYSRGLYYHNGETLWINLYIASELRWKRTGLTIRQRTQFPNANTVRIEIAARRPVRATLRLRHPHWSAPSMGLRLNGRPIDPGRPGEYRDLAREWRDGDTIDIELRMPLRIERLRHHPSTFAILAGPTVLAATLGDALMSPAIPYARANQYEWRKAPDPVIVPALATAGRPIEQWVRPDPLTPLVWHTHGAGHPADVTLVPFHQVAHERYVVYFDESTGPAPTGAQSASAPIPIVCVTRLRSATLREPPRRRALFCLWHTVESMRPRHCARPARGLSARRHCRTMRHRAFPADPLRRIP